MAHSIVSAFRPSEQPSPGQLHADIQRAMDFFHMVRDAGGAYRVSIFSHDGDALKDELFMSSTRAMIRVTNALAGRGHRFYVGWEPASQLYPQAQWAQ